MYFFVSSALIEVVVPPINITDTTNAVLNTNKVTFTPAVSYQGQASVRYDIKSGLNNEEPYVDESYRSLPATITVLVNPPEAIVTNLMLQPQIK